MPYVNTDAMLAYFPVHKCANTTIKAALCLCEDDTIKVQTTPSGSASLARDGVPLDPHAVMKDKITYAFAQAADVDFRGCFKFAVVRDPVSRICSMFANKVLMDGQFRKPRTLARINELGLNPEPTLWEFLSRFKAYRRADRVVMAHSRPLEFFLGRDPDYFDRIFRINQVDEVLDLIGRRFAKQVPDLSMKNSSKSHRLEPDDASKAKIKEIYASDYALFGKYFP